MDVASEDFDHNILVTHGRGEIVAVERQHVVRAQRSDIVAIDLAASDVNRHAEVACQFDVRVAHRTGRAIEKNLVLRGNLTDFNPAHVSAGSSLNGRRGFDTAQATRLIPIVVACDPSAVLCGACPNHPGV
jgi:hypothetical protein